MRIEAVRMMNALRQEGEKKATAGLATTQC